MCNNSNEMREILLKTTNNIDSALWGRNRYFLPYTHNGLNYSNEKTKQLIDQLISAFETSKNVVCSIPLKEFHSEFYKFAILFCELQCNKDEWTFESIVKLSRTLEKVSNVSTADILVAELLEEHAASPDTLKKVNELKSAYSSVFKLYSECYTPNFSNDILLSINTFLMQKNLCLFCNEESFNQALSILNIAAHRIHQINVTTQGDTNEQ